ncbi:MAG: Trp family transcriptional regulator [bacterium]
MPPVSHRKLDPGLHDHLTKLLVQVLAATNQTKSGLLFVHQFLSSSELTMLAKRVGVALLLKRGHTYQTIMGYLKVSKGTVAKISEIVHASDSETQDILSKIIADKQIDELLSKVDYYLGRLLPPKGRDWKIWRKNLEDNRRTSEKPI